MKKKKNAQSADSDEVILATLALSLTLAFHSYYDSEDFLNTAAIAEDLLKNIDTIARKNLHILGIENVTSTINSLVEERTKRNAW